MQLSPHFSLREMARTDHRRYAEQNLEEAQQPAILRALTAWCNTIGEPLRQRFGRPVVMHSGFRCAPLNRAIGGAKGSQHLRGEAGDLHVSGVGLTEVWHWLSNSGIPFGQLILEGYVGGEPSWVHVSLGAPWRAPSRCGEVMAAEVDQATGRAVYRLVRRVR